MDIWTRYKKKIMLKQKTTRETLYKLSELIEAEIPFHHIRMGDGRIMMAGGDWGGDYTDHMRNNKLVEILRKIIAVDDPYFLIGASINTEIEAGIREGTFGSFKNNDKLVEILQRYTKKKVFENSISMHYLALYEPELVIDFFKNLRNKKVVVVGGRHLEKMLEFDFVDDFIFTPATEAFEMAESLNEEILKTKPDIVLMACGACSHVLQYWIYQTENKISTIDIGSFADLCLGINSRQWINDNLFKVKYFIDLFNKNFKNGK